MNATSSPQPPLHGVRVLDLTRLLPGPMCTLHLADLGADVIKIEDLGAGDYVAPAVRELVNRNKRGIRIDLKQAAGVEALLKLVEGADVLVEGFRPGVMQRLGLGYDTLCARNPRLVMCSISGYGQTGPLASKAGHDLNYCGYAGVAHQMGTPDGRPAMSNLPVADLLGGTMPAVMGILAALYDAQRSGQGRHVDVAIADGVLAHAVIPMAGLLTYGATPPTGGDKLTGGLPCYKLYTTADGRYLAVAAFEKKFWDEFCRIMGRPDLAECHTPDTPEQVERVTQEVAAVVAARTFQQWSELLQDTDCCVTPVLRLDEALNLEHFRQREMWVEVATASGERMTQIAPPLRMTGFQFEVRRPAPLQGEHTREILLESGFDEHSVAGLYDSAVIK